MPCSKWVSGSAGGLRASLAFAMTVLIPSFGRPGLSSNVLTILRVLRGTEMAFSWLQEMARHLGRSTAEQPQAWRRFKRAECADVPAMIELLEPRSLMSAVPAAPPAGLTQMDGC